MKAVLVILLIVVAVPVIFVIVTYNRLVRLKQHMKESWHDIDVELKRRYDLIPNFVEAVKGYAAHERETLSRVIELRSRAAQSTGSAESQARDENALLGGLKQLYAVAEAYPQLRADANFRHLQEELANTEDRIAAARRFFNANVRELNQLCQTFPTNLIARQFGFEQSTYFELSSEVERAVPHVQA